MKVIMLIWDGLRPEFLDDRLAPSLCALAKKGTQFKHHSGIFPTETRVNASSLATGQPPATHGIVANRFYDRERDRTANTGDHLQVEQVSSEKGLFPCPTFCESLQSAGFKTLVVGSGSPGSTYLQAPQSRDLVVNTRGFVWPESQSQAIYSRYGPFPGAEMPPDPWNDLAMRILADGLEAGDYDMGLVWLCDPDYTQHEMGLGSDASKSAIRRNDERLGRLLDRVGPETTVLLASDHGFSTVVPTPRATDWLGVDPESVKTVSPGLYLADPDRELERIVASLRQQPWVGPILTKDSGDGQLGVVEETFSTKLLRIDHDARSPDIVFSHRWRDDGNAFGIAGQILREGGTAPHGSLSRFDRRAVLVAAGPGFASATTHTPTSALDIAPTIQHLFGIDESDLPGRILSDEVDVHLPPSGVEVVNAGGRGGHYVLCAIRVHNIPGGCRRGDLAKRSDGGQQVIDFRLRVVYVRRHPNRAIVTFFKDGNGDSLILIEPFGQVSTTETFQPNGR